MISKRQCQFAFLVLVMVAANELVWAVGKTVVTLDITKCHKSTDSNVVISYCTQAIESGQLSGKVWVLPFIVGAMPIMRSAYARV